MTTSCCWVCKTLFTRPSFTGLLTFVARRALPFRAPPFGLVSGGKCFCALSLSAACVSPRNVGFVFTPLRNLVRGLIIIFWFFGGCRVFAVLAGFPRFITSVQTGTTWGAASVNGMIFPSGFLPNAFHMPSFDLHGSTRFTFSAPLGWHSRRAPHGSSIRAPAEGSCW